jgi:hypothetical protein
LRLRIERRSHARWRPGGCGSHRGGGGRPGGCRWPAWCRGRSWRDRRPDWFGRPRWQGDRVLGSGRSRGRRRGHRACRGRTKNWGKYGRRRRGARRDRGGFPWAAPGDRDRSDRHAQARAGRATSGTGARWLQCMERRRCAVCGRDRRRSLRRRGPSSLRCGRCQPEGRQTRVGVGPDCGLDPSGGNRGRWCRRCREIGCPTRRRQILRRSLWRVRMSWSRGLDLAAARSAARTPASGGGGAGRRGHPSQRGAATRAERLADDHRR